MHRELVLLVEDDSASRAALRDLVSDEGFDVVAAESLAAAREHLRGSRLPGLVLTDFNLPDGEGTDLVPEAKDLGCDVVLITGEATVEAAVVSLRLGVADFLTKPVDVPRLTTLLKGFRRSRRLTRRVGSLETELQQAGRFAGMVGASKPMQAVYRLLQKVAASDATVMVVGESGTGKELVARAVHDLSERSDASFVPLNCGAISETLIESELFGHEKGSFTGAAKQRAGLFEQADGGTLFLDEITEMPVDLQVKLLRVLEEGVVRRVGGSRDISLDVRIVAATNRDPVEAVDSGVLREDLYYRLRVFPIDLPPLRLRRGDVELLLRHFLDQLNREHGTTLRWSDAAVDAAERYPWPGNVRELRNAVERAHVLAEGTIELEDLPPEVGQTEGAAHATTVGPVMRVGVGSRLADVERRLILATVRESESRQEAADLLGINVKTLYNRLKQYEAE